MARLGPGGAPNPHGAVPAAPPTVPSMPGAWWQSRGSRGKSSDCATAPRQERLSVSMAGRLSRIRPDGSSRFTADTCERSGSRCEPFPCKIPRCQVVTALRSAEFFAGMGLMRAGLKRSGIETVFANDVDESKASSSSAMFAICGVGTSPPSTWRPLPYPCVDLSLAGYRPVWTEPGPAWSTSSCAFFARCTTHHHASFSRMFRVS